MKTRLYSLILIIPFVILVACNRYTANNTGKKEFPSYIHNIKDSLKIKLDSSHVNIEDVYNLLIAELEAFDYLKDTVIVLYDINNYELAQFLKKHRNFSELTIYNDVYFAWIREGDEDFYWESWDGFFSKIDTFKIDRYDTAEIIDPEEIISMFFGELKEDTIYPRFTYYLIVPQKKRRMLYNVAASNVVIENIRNDQRIRFKECNIRKIYALSSSNKYSIQFNDCKLNFLSWTTSQPYKTEFNNVKFKKKSSLSAKRKTNKHLNPAYIDFNKTDYQNLDFNYQFFFIEDHEKVNLLNEYNVLIKHQENNYHYKGAEKARIELKDLGYAHVTYS